MKLIESIRRKAEKPDLTWTDVVSGVLATVIVGATTWTGRTLVVVATLRATDVI